MTVSTTPRGGGLSLVGMTSLYSSGLLWSEVGAFRKVAKPDIGNGIELVTVCAHGTSADLVLSTHRGTTEPAGLFVREVDG